MASPSNSSPMDGRQLEAASLVRSSVLCLEVLSARGAMGAHPRPTLYEHIIPCINISCLVVPATARVGPAVGAKTHVST